VQRRHLCYFLSIISITLLISSAAAQTNAFQEMQQGRQALSQAKYDEAIQHFEKVLEAIPANVNAQFYLGSAYAQKYVPGVDKEDNTAVAKLAIEHYQKVLDNDKFSTFSHNAAKSIGLLDAQMNKFDESRTYYAKAKELDPGDPEPSYCIALIDWTQASQLRAAERAKLNLKPEESLAAKSPTVCAKVREKNWPNLEDGIANLKQALKVNPEYEQAATYMNLIYLERADIECTDPAARKADLMAANEWTQKLATIKKTKATHPKPKDDDDDQ